MAPNNIGVVFVFALMSSSPVFAQSNPPEPQTPASQISQTQQDPGTNAAPAPSGSTSAPATSPTVRTGQQPKRILGIYPNFRAVSADTVLPPLSPKGKLWLATQGSFDYTSFLWAGIAAGFGQLQDSSPEFGQGAAGYARRYWHWMAVGATGNYMTEALFPIALGEDPRYYTLGRGNVLHRTGYAVSRLVVTKRDSGRWAANFSEIPGNLAGAAISVNYYPSQERTWVKTYQLWASQVAVDGLSNILKEFWPDIARVLPGSGRNKSSNH